MVRKSICLATIVALLVLSGSFFSVVSRAEESSTSTSPSVLESTSAQGSSSTPESTAPDVEASSTSETTSPPDVSILESMSTQESSSTSTPLEVSLTPESPSTPEIVPTLESSSTQELTPPDAEASSTSETTSPPDIPVPEQTSTSTQEISLTLEASSTLELKPTPTPVPTSTPEIIKIPQKYLSFSLEGNPIKSEKDLPWFPGKFKTEGSQENTGINIGISGQGSSKIILNGACQKDYFVILVFSRPNDYVEDPSRFIYNKAFPCQNGSYSYELNDLSEDIPEGTYYFMVAEEGLTGPWQPITAIQPVRISAGYR
jgi:hypothetical protein